MDNIINIDTVDCYNKLFGLETLHPLVSVVDLSKATTWPEKFRLNYGVYSLFLKEVKCGDIRYGRQLYDFSEGTIVSFAPGQVTDIEMAAGQRPMARGILFHPDLIKGTSLGSEIRNYSFFSYDSTEALHLSEQEKAIVTDCLNKIHMELQHAIDKHTKRLISRNIELLLDYCMRFYERQFITRSGVNGDVLVKFEKLLDNYFQDEELRRNGLPTVKYFADKICLSANYFGDLIKKETGKSAQEYIHQRLVDQAKEWILGTDKTASQIAFELGFQYSQHFNRLFKKNVGCTPSEYRKSQV